MGESFKDQRRFGRKRVVMEGTLNVPLRPPVPCLIHDLTPDGALIEVEGAGRLPANFHLRVEAAGVDTRCEVVHRDAGRFVGVAFEGRTKGAAPHIAHAQPQAPEQPAKLAASTGNAAFRKHLQRRLT